MTVVIVIIGRARMIISETFLYSETNKVKAYLLKGYEESPLF
jgi:hypothetical protein